MVCVLGGMQGDSGEVERIGKHHVASTFLARRGCIELGGLRWPAKFNSCRWHQFRWQGVPVQRSRWGWVLHAACSKVRSINDQSRDLMKSVKEHLSAYSWRTPSPRASFLIWGLHKNTKKKWRQMTGAGKGTSYQSGWTSSQVDPPTIRVTLSPRPCPEVWLLTASTASQLSSWEGSPRWDGQEEGRIEVLVGLYT